jgi:hypothetical protein
VPHQLFNLPPQQPLSAAGRVLPGSKLSFYLTTTSTPTPVYTTSALNVAHTQPLIADAGGRFASVYLDPTIVYKATVTDANDVLLYTVDPVNDQLLSQSVIGQFLYPRTDGEVSAAVTPQNYAYPPENTKRDGASAASSEAQNKTALDTRVTANGLVVVDADINYGYEETVAATHPDFSTATEPKVVIDYGPGQSYSGYPTAYDGAQVRYFFHTPQTTSFGQHAGNGMRLIGQWHPYLWVDNFGGGPQSPRRADDNRRASVFFGRDGTPSWRIGQGSVTSSTATDEELSNFCIQLFASAAHGDTLSDFTPLIIERSTGNWSIGAETNAPGGTIHVKSKVNAYQALFESNNTTSQIILRTSNGTGDDMGLRNVAGELSLFSVTLGNAVSVSNTNRRVSIAQSLKQARAVVTYSASMTIDAALGNWFIIAASNGSAFTINAPSNPADGQKITVTLKNTSGGALGGATWNGIFKMSAWTNPANGFNRSIVFIYDSAASAWFQVSQTGVDVPN